MKRRGGDQQHSLSDNPSDDGAMCHPGPTVFIYCTNVGLEEYWMGGIKPRSPMSRISIDVSPQEHQKLKALAALKGKSIKEFVIERTLGGAAAESQDAALAELESLLDDRIRSAERDGASNRTVSQIFKGALPKIQSR